VLGESGYNVIIFDNLSAGKREAALGKPLIQDDILNADAIRETLRKYHISAVMQFAASLSVADSVIDPKGYYQNNVVGTLSLLGAMVAESVDRLVFSSTAAIYGNPVETPITEGHAKNPINSYGETKLAIERALQHYDRAYGLKSICLRYFNASGADPDGLLGENHDPETHLIPRALDAVSGGPPLAIFGDDYETPDGTCLRDYIHVTDLASAHVLALRSLEEGCDSTAYNLGNGRPYSVKEVIEVVSQVTNKTVPCVVSAQRPGDPAILFASSDNIQRELNWTPHFNELTSIVETAWRWYQVNSGKTFVVKK
jgi:UDP-glucose 4-epimerase